MRRIYFWIIAISLLGLLLNGCAKFSKEPDFGLPEACRSPNRGGPDVKCTKTFCEASGGTWSEEGICLCPKFEKGDGWKVGYGCVRADASS